MSYTIPFYTSEGKKVESIVCDQTVFSQSIVNDSLIADAIRMQRANARIVIASTKNRGQVAGSNKKIYKQKGTGGARAGEKRSPIRRGGGVAFGPTSDRNYTVFMNKKEKFRATLGSLIKKIEHEDVLGLVSYDFSTIKTKQAVSVMKNIHVLGSKTLFVISHADDIVQKSMNNIEGVKVILYNYLNPLDILMYSKIVFVGDSFVSLQNHFLSKISA